ncbi:MAG: hypothetical protein CM15mP129_04670 [Chloroflexota bacterium]|nr:MAG: hypothetical protein CM15mP129_04670 [Chloroflexota bacterium]
MRFVKDIELIIQKELNHTALIDCDLLSKVYINLIDQKEPTLNFQNNEKENYVEIKTQNYILRE